MHSLTELKLFFKQHNIKIKESYGWYFKCYNDTWTMLDDIFYLNNNAVTKKEVAEYVKKAPRVRYKPKMIRANKGYTNESDCVEVDNE